MCMALLIFLKGLISFVLRLNLNTGKLQFPLFRLYPWKKEAFRQSRYWLRLLGMALVFVAYFMFTNLGRKEGFSWRNRGVLMIIAATLIGAASALYDRFLMGTMKLDADMVQLHFSIDLLLVLGSAWALQRYLPFMQEEHSFKWRWSIVGIGVLLIVADWLFFHAIAQPDTQIGVLSVLRRCSVVVSFVTGAMVYREKRLGGKALALLLMLAGVIIIALA